MATIKQLPTYARTKVFRAIDDVLRRDPIISVVVRPENFRSWRGDPNDGTEFSFSSSPAIRLTPYSGPADFKFPEAMMSMLYIKVEMLIPGTNADDQLNLWGAIEQALHTKPTRYFNDAGAWPGTPTFQQPAFDIDPTNQFFYAVGGLQTQVRVDFVGPPPVQG